MSRTRIPCLSPQLCGVKFHYAGTQSRCQGNLTGSSGTSSLSMAGPRLAQSDEDDITKRVERIRALGNDPRYLEKLEHRQRLRKQIEEVSGQLRQSRGIHYRERSVESMERVRELTFQRRELRFQLYEVNDSLDAHKNVMAEIAASIPDDLAYDDESDDAYIGRARWDACHEVGSPEWLNHRNTGVGGSDLNGILNSNRSGLREMAQAKTRTFGEEDRQDTGDWSTAAGRGNAYENLIAWNFSQKSESIEGEHLEVILNKSTYRGEHEWQLVNFDGLLRREGEDQPCGIIECKTSSDPDEWGDSIPMGYYIQTKHYLHTTGLEFAYIGVCMDARMDDMTYYRIDRGDAMYTDDDSYDDYIPEVAEFWENRHKIAGEHPVPRKYPFNGSQSNLEELAAYRGESIEETGNAIESHPSDDIERIYLDLHASAPRQGKRVYVDLETTGEEVIEFGAVVEDEQGNVVDSYSELFSADPRFVQRNGTGFEEIHGITPEMIQGKRSFAEAAPDIRRFMGMDSGEPITMVAHNASYEKRFMDQEIDGFYAAHSGEDPQIRVLDTMHLSQRVVHSTKNNKLQSLVERFGSEYDGAHRAQRDAEMTRDALNAFHDEMSKTPGELL